MSGNLAKFIILLVSAILYFASIVVIAFINIELCALVALLGIIAIMCIYICADLAF